MLLLTQGEAGIDCCDPFVDALKKRSTVQKYGPHIFICDLLAVALRDGSLLFVIYCFRSHESFIWDLRNHSAV